jgi:hypothetical protein
MSAKEIVVEMLKAEAHGAGVLLTPEGEAWLDRMAEEDSGIMQILLERAEQTA